jgi:hypothetical protein
MRVGLSIAADVPAGAPDLEGALVGAELLPYDDPCDVRVAWCRSLSDVPVLAAFVARAPLYVMLESPLTVEETKRALSSGILEVIDFGSRSERLARLRARIARRRAVDERLSEAIREPSARWTAPSASKNSPR